MTLKLNNNTSTAKRERESNLELLRILATIFVIILHYNNENNGKGFLFTEALPQHYQMLVCFEMIAICAVNIFVMLSGYFMCNSKKADAVKVLRLYADVVFLSVFRYFLNCTIGSAAFSTSTLLYSMIPLSWYVAVYSALYLISPYLNRLIRGLPAAQFRMMLIICLLMFSVWPSISELITALTGMKLTSLSPFGTQGSGAGYTIVNFVLMYFLGAYLKMHGSKNVCCKSIFSSLAVYALCTVLLIFYSKIYFPRALSYCNPLVIIQTIAIFKAFQSMKLKSKCINAIASCSFGVYLLHTYFLKYIQVEHYVTGNILLVPVHVIVSSILIYGISALIYWIYLKLLSPLLNKWLQKLSFLKYEVS